MKSVLIIDDDANYRRTMAELLEHHGWQVLQADQGDEGITLARSRRPQVMLCDLLMARGNGFQVCRAVRRDESLRYTKLVVTSGRDFESDRQAAFAAGADEYLTKPIQPAQLLELLGRLAGETTSAPPRPTALPPESKTAPAWIRFWGVRGSIATPGPSTVLYGGNTSCVEVRAEGQIIILDAGTGLRLLGRELMAEFDGQPLDLTLLLTHTHWDHIQGLPFFLPVYKPQNQLRILGFEGARHGLDNVLTGQMESPFFPIGLREVPANVKIEELKDLTFQVGPVRVEVCFANHPGICVGYRLFTAGKSVAFFPDNEPHRGQRRAAANSPTVDQAALDYAQQQDAKMVQFLRGVNVLIMDTQYDCEEYQQHVGWGHGCLDDVVALAIEAGVEQLFLFHHDPNHDDARVSRMVEHARELVIKAQATLQVEAAREGEKVSLA